MSASESRSDIKKPAAIPGSYIIRPTRNEAEKSLDAFYDLLTWSQNNEGLTLKKIHEVIGVQTLSVQSNMSKKSTKRKFTDAERQLLLKHLYGESALRVENTRSQVRKLPHALYFSLLSFMGTRETSQDNARAAIEGTFKFWRHSVDHPGEFVLGKLVFAEDPATRAVTVKMYQAKQSLDGARRSRSEADGYFFKVGSAFLMLLHDESNREIRITLFSTFRFDWVGVNPETTADSDAQDYRSRSMFSGPKRHLVELSGHVLGIDGNRNFFSPIHATLVDDVDQLAALDAELDVIEPSDPHLPRRIETKLNLAGPLKIL